MRKESSTLQKCKRQMATLGFDSQLAYHRVKLILKIYRDVVWVLSERVEELHEYAWELGAQDADTGLIGILPMRNIWHSWRPSARRSHMKFWNGAGQNGKTCISQARLL